MQEFPIIYTNFWDANLVGLFISIFFAHRGNLSAGIFMGLFYGNAAVGVYSSIKTTLRCSKFLKKYLW